MLEVTHSQGPQTCEKPSSGADRRYGTLSSPGRSSGALKGPKPLRSRSPKPLLSSPGCLCTAPTVLGFTGAGASLYGYWAGISLVFDTLRFGIRGQAQGIRGAERKGPEEADREHSR